MLQESDACDRYAVRMGRGGGKTAFASWKLLHFILTRDRDELHDWKALTTAGAWNQLTNYLWPEVHKWAHKIKWWKVGRDTFKERAELLDTDIKLPPYGRAFAVASEQSGFMEGAHADKVFCLLDEAAIIPDKSWDAIEGVLSGHGKDTPMEGKVLAVGKARDMQGRFYQIHQRKAGLLNWKVRHITIDEIIKAGRISADWVEDVRTLWGPDSVLFKNEVLGEFAANTADAIIPLSWVEAAIERWKEWDAQGRKGKLTAIGVDVGGGQPEADASVMAPIMDRMKVYEIRHVAVGEPDQATMELVGAIHGLLDQAGTGIAIIDMIGIGLGVLHRLRELGDRAEGFGSGSKTDLREKSGERGFVNWRAAMWWVGREILEPGSGFNVCLPPDDRLIGELTAPHSTVVSAGQILVEPKEKIRRRIGHSTDYADAVLMGLIGPILLDELARATRQPGISYNPVQIVNY